MFIDRICEVQIGGLLFNSEEFEIVWGYSVGDDDTPANFDIKIANLSQETNKQINILDSVVLKFGYEKDAGIFATGFIDEIEVDRNGTDHWTNLRCIEAETDIQKKVSRSYSKGTKSSYIIKDLCSICNLNLKELDLGSDKTFNTGYNIYSKPIMALRELAGDCGCKMEVSGKNVRIYTKKTKKEHVALLTFESGLLANPLVNKKSNIEEDEIEHDITVKALALNDVKKGDLIKVECPTLNAVLLVAELDISDWEGEYKCLEVSQ